MEVDGLRERLQCGWKIGWEKRNDYLKRLISNLDHLSPLHILGKGYSVVTQEGSKKAIKSSESLKKGDYLNIRFAVGEAKTEVLSTKK